MSKSLFAYFQGSWKKGIPYVYTGNTWKKIRKINASTLVGWKPDRHVHVSVSIAAIPPTCTTIGYTSGKKCAECNEFLIEPQPIPSLGHQWTDWTITEQPTEDLEGKQQRSCTQCLESETTTIPKLNHTHNYIAVPAKNATCTQTGNKAYYHCDGCQTYFDDQKQITTWDDLEIPVTGHTWGEWEISDSPTCTREGKQKRECSNCSYIETKTISATGVHDFNNTILWSYDRQEKTAATCTQDATYWVECRTCTQQNGKYFTAAQCDKQNSSIEPKKALGHSPATTVTWGSQHSSASVACTRSGCETTWSGTPSQVTTQTADCITKRKYKHTVTINVNGTNKEFTCNEQHTGSVDLTKHNVQCAFVADSQESQCGHYSNCGVKVETHSFPGSDKYYFIPLENGTQHQAAVDCINCGYTKTGATKNCTYTVTKEATCTTSGTKTCNDCDRTVTIEALGHTWANGVCTKCSTTCNHVYIGTGCTRNCKTCGMVNTFHADPDGNGTCNICGAAVFVEK